MKLPPEPVNTELISRTYSYTVQCGRSNRATKSADRLPELLRPLGSRRNTFTLLPVLTSLNP
jgi:hypothetical protein